MEKQKRIIFFLLLLIEIVLLISGVGMISNGSLSITILQIPVILVTIVSGLPYGLVTGAVFGIGTMIAAAGCGKETLDHLFVNPVLSVLPRLLIAVMAWLVYKQLKKIMDDHTISSECIAGVGAAFAGTVTNTVLVMLILSILYPDMLAESTAMHGYASAFISMVGANTSLEICIAVPAVAIGIYFLKKKEVEGLEIVQRPMRKHFQKWLSVVMAGGFVVTIFCSYILQTIQAENNAEEYLNAVLARIEEELEEKKDYHSVRLQIDTQGTLLLAENGQIISAGDERLIGSSLKSLGVPAECEKEDLFAVVWRGSTYLCKAVHSQNRTVIGMILRDEIFEERNETAVILLFVNLTIFAAIFLLISKLLQDQVINRIYHVNQSLSEIQSGNLDELVEVRSNEEFSVLSDGINATVNALKETMEEVAASMDQEMKFAREIQHSALPVAEHVAPKRKEYEIFGVMDAAREVGGDFYDYFFAGEDKLCFVIADVSGKGVPAALFMMTAKTLLKNFILNGKSPAEALELANTQLCENNEAGMFVTAWLGILDYSTGEMEFANAGHNPPLLKKREEAFVYMDHKTYKRSIMLGMRDGVRYKNNRISFERGDMLCLYTDGVTEANNSDGSLYGEERLKRCMDENYALEPKELVQMIRADIDNFAGEAEQFDDITMVILKMNAEWKQIEAEAVYENTQQVADFLEKNLPKECSKKIRHQILIAFDEVYSNIVKYSRAKQFQLRLGILDDMIYLEFIDDGVPYNPLESKDPDVQAPMEERAIGGLGLFVVKRTMDYTEYRYKDEKNIFMLGKKFL